jgi:cell division protein FtsB
MTLDMNESETPTTQPAPPEPQGIPTTKLLEIIGKQQVEWIVEEEGVAKLKEQAVSIFKQNQTLAATVAARDAEIVGLRAEPAKPVAVPTELAKLQAVNNAKDEEIHLLENQVHTVAQSRDAAVTQAQAALMDLKKARDDYATLQYECGDLQRQVDAIPKAASKGKKK